MSNQIIVVHHGRNEQPAWRGAGIKRRKRSRAEQKARERHIRMWENIIGDSILTVHPTQFVTLPEDQS